MSDGLTIQSHKGPYRVHFDVDALARLNASVPEGAHFLVDARVAELYRDRMGHVLASRSVLLIEATEAAKSLERFPAYVEHLVANGLRRDHVLVAIGGGILQDITCFLSATMLRGVDWRFYPTTLLAQCDSCIGSKSSINCGDAKNILGTFTPPRDIFLSTRFLATLDPREIRSGIGEMLKVHMIAGPADFAAIAQSYDSLWTQPTVMEATIRRALEIKQGYIEKDEFDTGPRLVFNLGHSFGHAIEAATDFAVPHGIAVTIGLDMAGWMSWRLGSGAKEYWCQARPVLARNYAGYQSVPVPLDRFLAALAKDKKNVGQGSATLILPGPDGQVARAIHIIDEPFRRLCAEFLDKVRPHDP
ncbi:AroB-related putative sugar phosphate phospholyase (cyclizing) [Magnetospirillum moscoviense]|uniref:AroB-related putative sugar phosphate phospholyase (cyclizing) n=1 Tax=Magnetospirillum moscoviense TaxID=1437059 RepID=UPI000AA2EC9B|nr:AroB-related putative sugar phosphate phospholyase (cyclizing) [Magnetospirillum moscoviense]